MRRHVQTPGIRNWYGEDLIDLQKFPFEVLDEFFTQYGNFILSGCEVTSAGNGKYNVAPGLLVLKGRGGNTPIENLKAVVRFDGLTDVELPVWISAKTNPVERKYADNELHTVYEEYTTFTHTSEPYRSTVKIDVTGNVRFTDIITDSTHRFATDSQIKKWNDADKNATQALTDASSKSAQALKDANAYTDDKTGEVLSEAKKYTESEVGEALDTAFSHTDDKVAQTLDSAKNYTDNEISGAREAIRGYVDERDGEISLEARRFTEEKTRNCYAGYDYVFYPGEDLSLLTSIEAEHVLIKSGVYILETGRVRMNDTVKSVTGEPGTVIRTTVQNTIFVTHHDCSLSNIDFDCPAIGENATIGTFHGFKGIRNCNITANVGLMADKNNMALIDNCSDVIGCRIIISHNAKDDGLICGKPAVRDSQNIVDCDITGYWGYGIWFYNEIHQPRGVTGGSILYTDGIYGCSIRGLLLMCSKNIENSLFEENTYIEECHNLIRCQVRYNNIVTISKCYGLRNCDIPINTNYSSCYVTHNTSIPCGPTAAGGFNTATAPRVREEQPYLSVGKSPITGFNSSEGYYQQRIQHDINWVFTTETIFTTGSNPYGSVYDWNSSVGHMFIEAGKLNLTVGKRTTQILNFVSPNTSYHVVASANWPRGIISIYINSKLVASPSFGSIPLDKDGYPEKENLGNVRIGCNGSDQQAIDTKFKGSIHRFRYFDRALTEVDVLELWNNGAPHLYKWQVESGIKEPLTFDYGVEGLSLKNLYSSNYSTNGWQNGGTPEDHVMYAVDSPKFSYVEPKF